MFFLCNSRTVFSSTSLLVTRMHLREPLSSAFRRHVACMVVPEPAKKSRISAFGLLLTTAARQSLTAYTDFGKGNRPWPPRNFLSSSVPCVPASCAFSHQTVLSLRVFFFGTR